MNYIKHLTGFFDKVVQDDNLNPSHISLYIAVFQFWNVARFRNPISISREEVMRISKISSKATYHKCMKDLHNFGYLNYNPSFNPFRGSLITLFDLELRSKQVQKKVRSPSKISSGTEQVLNKSQTATEQELEPYTNISNISNNLNLENDEKNPTKKINSASDPSFGGNTKRPQQQEKKYANVRATARSGFARPVLQQIRQYFLDRSWPALQAEKFFHQYQSNGWLVGKVPMDDWHSAAEKWILNSTNFTNDNNQQSKPDHLKTTRIKNYDEPL